MTTRTRYIVDIVEHPDAADVGERARWFWQALVLVDGKCGALPGVQRGGATAHPLRRPSERPSPRAFEKLPVTQGQAAGEEGTRGRGLAMMTEAIFVGVCVDCGGRAQPRANWNAIAPAYRADKLSFHHRCSRCYTFRQLDAAYGGKAIRAARRAFTCEACAEVLPKGSPARVFMRTRDMTHQERALVCVACVADWLQIYTLGAR